MPDKMLSIKTSVAYPGFSLEAALDLPLDSVTAIIGPSGAGKSTLLRLIAGFEKPDSGYIKTNAATWVDSNNKIYIPAHKRPVGYMFQDARLFSHLSVLGNLEFANNRSDTIDSPISFDDVVARFDLAPLLDRQPSALSGGERQRVALARTILSRPDILLLDEPLSALDTQSKTEILPFLESIPEIFGIPILYVSHNIHEVYRIADNILVLKKGRVHTFGPALDIINAPEQSLTSEDGDCVSLLEGTIKAHNEDFQLTEIAVNDVVFKLPMMGGDIGKPVRLLIQARDVGLSLSEPGGLSIQNVIQGIITDIASDTRSPYAMVTLDIGKGTLRSRITRASMQALNLKPGMRVYALVKSAIFER